MEELEFSVPYNDCPEILPELFRLKERGNNRIREIYLSGPQEYFGSGRITPIIKFDEFAEIVDKIHKVGIRVNLLLNSTCEGIDWYSSEVVKSTMEYLSRVHEELGVEAITIANPLYVREVRNRFPDIEICASVLGDIDCVQRAIIYSKFGANVITPDVNINRDLKLLKQIKDATNVELKLMVNEGCLYKCPLRKFHFNSTSHMSKEVGKVRLPDGTFSMAKEVGEVGLGLSSGGFTGICNKLTSEDPSQVLKSCWIRPEDTKKYSGITSFFKIVGRSQPRSAVIRTTKAYLEESWDGDLLDILCASLSSFGRIYGAYLDNKTLGRYKFFEKVISCDRNCSQCSYCEELARRLIGFGILSQEKIEDIEWVPSTE